MWSKLPRQLKILLTSTIFANIGSRMYRPFLPLYILSLGGTVEQVGFLFTLDTIAEAILRPLGGWLSDSIGRLQAVAIGTLWGLAASIGFVLAPTWGWLILVIVLLTAGRSLVGPSFRAYTAEAAPEGQTAQTFGLVNGLYTVCQVIGPLFGGWLVTQYGLKAMFWGAVVFMVLATVTRQWAAWGLEYRWETVQFTGLKTNLKGMFAGMLAGGAMTWLLLTDGIADFGINVYENLRSILLENHGLNEAQIGYLFSFHAVVYLLVSLFGSRMADRWPVGALALGRGVHAMALFLLAVAPSVPVFILYFGLDAVAFGLGDPAFDMMLVRTAPKGSLGMTFGLLSTTVGLFAMPAPYLGGLLWERIAPTTPFWVGAVALGLAGVLVWGILGVRLGMNGKIREPLNV